MKKLFFALTLFSLNALCMHDNNKPDEEQLSHPPITSPKETLIPRIGYVHLPNTHPMVTAINNDNLFLNGHIAQSCANNSSHILYHLSYQDYDSDYFELHTPQSHPLSFQLAELKAFFNIPQCSKVPEREYKAFEVIAYFLICVRNDKYPCPDWASKTSINSWLEYNKNNKELQTIFSSNKSCIEKDLGRLGEIFEGPQENDKKYTLGLLHIKKIKIENDRT